MTRLSYALSIFLSSFIFIFNTISIFTSFSEKEILITGIRYNDNNNKKIITGIVDNFGEVDIVIGVNKNCCYNNGIIVNEDNLEVGDLTNFEKQIPRYIGLIPLKGRLIHVGIDIVAFFAWLSILVYYSNDEWGQRNPFKRE